MSKILVEIHVPMLEKQLEIYIPLSIKMNEVEMLVSKACRDISKGYFKVENDPLLCDYESGKALDRNRTVFENGLKNGSKLLLI